MQPIIPKQLYYVLVRPVIFKGGTPEEEGSEFLNFHLKLLMKNSWSYICDSLHFANKIKRI